MNAFISIKKFLKDRKLVSVIFSALLILMLAACGDQPKGNTKGSEQIDGPVLNSGPQTEAERAVDATSDSAKDIDKSTDSAFTK